MDSDFEERIHQDRLRLQNPYAHVVDDGKYDALPPVSTSPAEPAREPSQDQVHQDRLRLGNQYAHVGEDGKLEALPPVSTSPADNAPEHSTPNPTIDLGPIRRKAKARGQLTRSKIEGIVRDLQRELWRVRGELFPEGQEVDPLDLLDPDLAFRSLGFRAELVESLGQHRWEGEPAEVAGIIDASERTVRISRRFEPQVRRFTAAHELGHAVLHDARGLHRDRAVDGSQLGGSYDRTEREADIFATCFLMPEKLVRAAFEKVFKARTFVLTEDTAFALNPTDPGGLLDTRRSDRDLSRMLAGATRYDGVHFVSLADQFGVSVEAMAIRLEELKVVTR